jgi:primary-amine oxidase
LDIDGSSNTVYEVDAVAEPMGPANPHGAAYVTRKTAITREGDAARLLDLAANRYWTVANPNRHNHVGGEVAYKLVGNHNTLPMASPDSVIGRRAGFMYRHLWVTRNDTEQRYPAGDYPFQHAGGAGLPEWVKADRSLTDTDVVLWYVFGVNHIPRLEDWPVMPVERLGFTLKPNGFFRRSPAMDVAPSPARCCTVTGPCTCDH